MDERNQSDSKLDEIMLPGFRFHPTDEELVGFYLKRKIQQRPLSIELIKQLDIYKYNPWDLPKMATTGEKEWYFYCPRDRKYRNSARPNRVTEAGFWKATGTDRPIYSSEGTKCIGLKKSLVFYRGRAAKGVKTDWMMHEFRLPSVIESSTTKRFIDKTIPANDTLAICRIFKKTNTTAQRALSQSWVSSVLPETTTLLSKDSHFSSQFSNLENIPLTPRNSTPPINFYTYNDRITTHPSDNFSYKPINQISTKLQNHQLPISNFDFSSSGLIFSSPFESSSEPMNGFCNTSSDPIEFSNSQCNGFSIHLPNEFQNVGHLQEEQHEMMMKNSSNEVHSDEQWEIFKSINGFPFGLPLNMGDAWKSNFLWDSSSCCPSEMSTTKCFT